MGDFFESTIVISWIAPVITGVIVVIITSIAGKIISIWWKNRAFIRKVEVANEKYVNNILPYMIQEIDLNKEVLHRIKSAISLAYQIDIKYMYTNQQICNQIILSISDTRFMTECNKARLIDNVISVFNGIEDYVEKTSIVEKKKNLDKKYPMMSLVSGLAFTAIICIGNTDKIDDPNSWVQVIVLIGLIIIMMSIFILWLLILDDIMPINLGRTDGGIIDVTNQAMQALGNATREVLFGKRRRKRKEDD